MAESKSEAGAITAAHVDKFHAAYESDAKNVLAMNVVTGQGIMSVKKRTAVVAADHTFSVKVKTEGKATSQKSSGRCWLFAGLNVMRTTLMEKYKLPDSFELSQNYMFFWDKFEKANYFLESILKTVNEPVESRVVSHLLHAPVNDGGQWDMFINIVDKYGVVPKTAFPESHQSGMSRRLNWVVTNKLRENAGILRTKAKAGASATDLAAEKEKMLEELYRVMVVHLGPPPKSFEWAFTNKDKEHTIMPNLTPRAMADLVAFKPAQHVSLINDPRNAYYKLYTVEYLGNVAGGRPVLYINVPSEELKKYARKTLESGKPVWFGCDVGKFFDRSAQVMDLDQFCYDQLLGIEFGMDKATRLRYGESLMTHAMVFTGVDVREDKPVKWRVENSWGDKTGDKGYAIMTDPWFDQYLYQIIVDKSMLAQDISSVLDQEPVVLPPWDPMGSLAC